MRQKIGEPDKRGIFEQVKKSWKLAKCGQSKIRSEGFVMAVTDGEIEGSVTPVNGEPLVRPRTAGGLRIPGE